MSLRCKTLLVAATLALLASPAWAEPVKPEDQLPPPPGMAAAPAPRPAPEGSLFGRETGSSTEAKPDATQPPPPPARARWWDRFLDHIAFHGYSRMPISVKLGDCVKSEGGGCDSTYGGRGPRAPLLLDADYYKSGFAYTRLHESDWTEMFLSYNNEYVSMEVGMFTSLLSDWSQIRTDQQWGIAQASLTWQRNFTNPVLKHLLVRAGMFWNRLGYIEPYDTYVFGRTHQGGIMVQAEFPWVELTYGMGAHLALPNESQGFTPLFYGSVMLKPPSKRWEAGFFALHEFTNDKVPLKHMEVCDDPGCKMTVVGFQARAMIPYLGGPLTVIPWAYYTMENARFLGPALELMHSSSANQLMLNYLGNEQDSKNGTGSFPWVAALDFPATLWKGFHRWPVMNGPITLRLFGMLAYVHSAQDFPDTPSKNYNKRTWFKWGFEPGIGIFPWLTFSVRYDRVILDVYDGDNSFRVISPKLTFRVFRWGQIFAMVSKYSYGPKATLAQSSVAVPPGVTQADDLVFKLQAQATW
jgi:hypothetical protein